MTSEQQYLDLLKNVLENGIRKENRTGVDTVGILGAQCRYNLSEGFPLFTTKRVWMKAIIHELLWFLSGSTNIKYLVDNDVNIWNDDAYRYYTEACKRDGEEPFTKSTWLELIKKTGRPQLSELGPVYGSQWRAWKHPHFNKAAGQWEHGIDQIKNLVKSLKEDPSSRRHILSAWNVADIDEMGLPPCHVMSMFSVIDNKLSCHMVQRSGDMFLGVPFNIASYSILTHMLAQVCGYEAGEFIHTLHDTHVYVTHIEAVKEQLSREPKTLPRLWLNPDVKDIDDFKYDDIKVKGYNSHPAIKAELAT